MSKSIKDNTAENIAKNLSLGKTRIKLLQQLYSRAAHPASQFILFNHARLHNSL